MDPVPSPRPTDPENGSSAIGISRRGALGIFAAGAAVAALPSPAWAVTDTRPGAVRAPDLGPDDWTIINRVSAERALEHIEVLSERIGPRIGGTQSEHAAANYIAGVLDRYGWDTTLQPFPVADKFLAEISGVGTRLPKDLCWQAGASPQGALDDGVRAAVVDVGAGAPENYPADVFGKIVLIDHVATQIDALVAAAVSRGAVAVVFLPADPADPIRRAQAFSPPLNPAVNIPVIGVATAQKYRLRALIAARPTHRPLQLRIVTTAHRNLTSYNVLGVMAPRNAPANNPVVMVSAHYDSVIGAPGANDDGSGTSLCVELARVFRRLRTDATLAVSLWGSEEQGLIGSRYYVAQLPQAERNRIRAVFQNDMVATSWDPATRYWILSFDGQPNSTNQAVIASAQRLGYEPSISPVTARGASDHQSFQEQGISSGNFTWRGEASPAQLEPPYHSPEDTIEKNISLERLQVSLELIGTAMYATAGPR